MSAALEVPPPPPPEQQHDPLLFTVLEAAAVLRIGKSLCYDLIQRRELPSIKVGGRLRVPAERLRAWIREQTREPVRSGR